ncbi:Hypothetical protein A7982_05598 [Minicystis rosea]|nr:Hypothetical protein A7982_05598 [Minicystis rosea]
MDGKFFATVLGRDEEEARWLDPPTKALGVHARHIMVEDSSKHGTNVAGNAAWGALGIKLVDVMIQKGQMSGAIIDTTAVRAFKWAIDEKEVSIINCSKVLPFGNEAVNDVLTRPGTRERGLFLATAVNTAISLRSQWRDARRAGERGRIVRSLRRSVGSCPIAVRDR